jgi:3-dehydroquinate synthase
MNEESTILLNVDLGERSYPISIGPALLQDQSLLARHVHGNKVAIVTNTTVAPLYLERVEAACALPASRSSASCCPTARSSRTGKA